ncbi:hypothetical protein [Catellatospora sp. NPDC049133]|uniref:hypothetical protein n=1 Tax=Catellatospora sp. NPDC049133 TaxID=3155499 RepID=UPI0033DC5B47
MSVLPSHWEIVTDGPVKPGSPVHRRDGHSWTTTRLVFGREEKATHHAPVPACTTPEPDQPPTSDARSYSAGWALYRGATVCTAQQCFPAEREEARQ